MKQLNYQHSKFSLKKFLLAAFSVAKIKLLIVFCYYWFATVSLTNFISFLLRNANNFSEDLASYISCTAGGYRPECEPLKDNLTNEESKLSLALYWIAFTFLATTSWVNLFFVIQLSDLKALINAMFKKSKTCCK